MTVTRTGAGSVKFEYEIPGVYGQTVDGNWSATVNKFARPSGCPSLGIVSTGGEWLYPNAPNLNYEYERGLLSRKSEYNLTGNLVRFTENTYQYIYGTGTQPVAISGLRYNNYALSQANAAANKIYFYGKYALYTNVDRILKKESVTLYDEADANKKSVSSIAYFYESSTHKLLTKVLTTTANGSTYTTKLKYIPDFGTIAANSEPALLSIRDMLMANRYSSPVEIVNTVQRADGIEKTTTASLTTFKTFATGGIQPEQTRALEITDPVTDFSSVSMQLQNGSYKLISDNRYQVTSTVGSYSQYGVPLTVTGLNKIPVSTVWGYSNTLPVAKINNSSSGEFAIADFETSSDASFQLTNAFYGSGRTGRNAIHPSATLTKNLIKASTSNNYILSFWLKRETADVSIQVKIKDASTTYYTTTIVVHPVGTDFEYFKYTIPAAGFPGTFTLEIKGVSPSVPSAGGLNLLPVMDDVAFYPETADASFYTYALPFGPDAVTDSRATTVYTDYDNLGRVSKILDKHKNILQKTTYRYAAKGALTAEFYATKSFVGEPTTFSALGNQCMPGAIYKWKINGVVLFGNPTTYTFPTSGGFSAALEVSAPGYPTVTYSQSQVAIFRPLMATLCAKGVQEFSASTNLVLASYSCPAITSSLTTTYGVIFQITSDPGTAVNYQWKRRQAGVSYWTNVGSNSYQYNLAKITSNETTFEVMCEVSTNEGRTGSSGIMMVTISQ